MARLSASRSVPDPATSFGDLARLFVRLGVTAFGGPAAHIAMMHDEVVRRRGWMDDQRFLDMVGATNLVPGPNSTEMAIHVGYDRRGWRGMLVSGAGFIVPAALIVLALAWAYVRYGSTPTGEALLYGVRPVIIAIILQALVALGRTAVRGWLLAGVAFTAAVLYLAGVNELLLLLAGALLVLAVRTVGASAGGTAVLSLPALWLPGAVPGWLGQAGGGPTVELPRLFGVFLKVGAVLYGSGYVLLAFLRGDLVQRLGWLTDTQLLDAVTIGQFTPGPVFTTATFVGYVLGGVAGAVVATVGIFLPAFLFVGALSYLLPRVRDRVWTAALLDGVNVAALGLMAAVTLQLGVEALVDPITVGLLAAAALALWRTRLNSAWLVAAGAVLGILASYAGMAEPGGL